MDSELKNRIISNTFVDGVRTSLVFDDAAYKDLCVALESLAQELKGSDHMDRELALVLYTMPVIIRNMYLSSAEHVPDADIAAKLEDAWVELDALVTACLSD